MRRETFNGRVLVVGSGGREHAFGWKIRKSDLVRKLYFAPGNAGTEKLGENVDIGAEEIDKLAQFAADKRIGLTIVGPERPLANGIRNQFDEDGLKLVGFTQESSILEYSKAWADGFAERHNIPHPQTKVFRKVGDALQFFESVNPQKTVIKTDGLWDGKGVILPKSIDEAINTITDMMVKDTYGEAGRIIVVQDRLIGRELSAIGITDGKVIRYFAPAVDHKTLFERTRDEREQNPNTGGMGAYAPDPLMTPKLMKEIHETIMQRAIDGMREEGYPLEGGILFAGLMITEDGPKVLEFNVRGGDPETEVQLMLMKNDLLPVLESSRDGTLSRRRIIQKKGAAVGVYLVSEGYPGKLVIGRVISGLDNNAFGEDIEIFHGGTKKENGQIKTSSGRVVCITAFGTSVPDASEKVYPIIDRGDIYFEGARYRPDIGGW